MCLEDKYHNDKDYKSEAKTTTKRQAVKVASKEGLSYASQQFFPSRMTSSYQTYAPSLQHQEIKITANEILT